MNTFSQNNHGRRVGTLLDWDPVRLFDHLMSWEPAAAYTPARLQTDEDGATLTLDMPGVDPADVELTFADGRLAIAGKRGAHTYRYSVELGDAIDPDHLEAELDKGVLTVRAHKKPEAKPRKIQLKAGSTKSLKSGDEK